ncbi:hypothetical protein Csa_023817, partial [Cucumis sativus]
GFVELGWLWRTWEKIGFKNLGRNRVCGIGMALEKNLGRNRVCGIGMALDKNLGRNRVCGIGMALKNKLRIRNCGVGIGSFRVN